MIIQGYLFYSLCDSQRLKKTEHYDDQNNQRLVNESRHLCNIVFFLRIFVSVCYIANANTIKTNIKIKDISKRTHSFSCYQLQNLLKYYLNTIRMLVFLANTFSCSLKPIKYPASAVNKVFRIKFCFFSFI